MSDATDFLALSEPLTGEASLDATRSDAAPGGHRPCHRGRAPAGRPALPRRRPPHGHHAQGHRQEHLGVDAADRSHDHPGVWVAGSSAFPTAGTANPTLTLATLTLRTADALANTL
ncbi:hypothetical protein GCM10010195_36650 [Kitasatospora griseola]|nr:hypothetical protein GCM10010195_36650 [Kitasatospora griseola]